MKSTQSTQPVVTETPPDVPTFLQEPCYHVVKGASAINALVASPLMHRSVACALLGAFHFGWMMAEMAYIPFHHPRLCQLPRIPHGQCLLFPGHSTAEWTMQSTAWAVGGGLGALLSAFPADRFGRKRTLGYNGVVMVAGGLVQLLAGDIYTFAIGRGLNGLASGVAINVLNNYLRELAPIQRRMFYMTLVQIALSVGTLVVTSFMYAIPDAPSSTWQFMPLFGGPVVIGVLQVAVMPCILESPIWLLHRRQVDQAHLVMNQLYLPGDDVDSHWSLLVATMERQTQETESSSSKLSLLVSAKYRKQFSIAVVLSTMQQLCGMNALVVYGPTMFKAIGIHELRLSSTIVNFGRFHDMYLGMKFGDRFNRRTLLLVGSAGMIVGSLGFTVCQTYPSATNNWVQITCMLAFVASFCMSVGSLGWIVSTELIPEVLGASSGAIATCCTWTAQFFIGVYFQQISSVGHWGSQAFGIFPAVLVVFVLFVWICVPDTRNQTTDQVTAMFYSDDDNQKPSDDDAFVYWTSDKENCILSSP